MPGTLVPSGRDCHPVAAGTNSPSAVVPFAPIHKGT
jgi:hypothetical protein